jgi:hypothetical protein
MRIFQAKAVEKKETYFMLNNFKKKNVVIYEIMWKNEKPDRPQMTV